MTIKLCKFNFSLRLVGILAANPDMLNSRFKNRLFYGGIGTKDLFQRSWKELSDFVSLEVSHAVYPAFI